MKKYLAFDGIDLEHEDFDTIEEARQRIKEIIYDPDEGYHPDMECCGIYELKEKVGYDVIDSKDNYKYVYEEDIPDDDNESEPWPYNTDYDEIWKLKFIPVK